jgi:S-adenosylmethionine hydrolase
MAVRLGAHTFVGPDNGLFTPMYLDAERSGSAVEFVHLTDSRYWLPDVSSTFHGRDIFAPAAAHLANGVPLADLGQPLADPVRLNMPRPEKTATGWRAHITVADVFGNLTTDLPAKEILHAGDILFRFRGREIHGLVEFYGHRQPGDLVALVDSEDFIEIAVVNGNAARFLEAKIGDIVEVILPS